MNGSEAKEACLKRSPVVWANPIYGAFEYEYIHHIVYHPADDHFIVGLALMDKTHHSITVAPMEEVELLVLQEPTQPRMRYFTKNKT